MILSLPNPRPLPVSKTGNTLSKFQWFYKYSVSPPGFGRTTNAQSYAVGPEELYKSYGWSYHKVLSENKPFVHLWISGKITSDAGWCTITFYIYEMEKSCRYHIDQRGIVEHWKGARNHWSDSWFYYLRRKMWCWNKSTDEPNTGQRRRQSLLELPWSCLEHSIFLNAFPHLSNSPAEWQHFTFSSLLYFCPYTEPFGLLFSLFLLSLSSRASQWDLGL